MQANAKRPEPTTPQPSEMALHYMLYVADATDGCTVEPDGVCEHGHVSWLVYLGVM